MLIDRVLVIKRALAAARGGLTAIDILHACIPYPGTGPSLALKVAGTAIGTTEMARPSWSFVHSGHGTLVSLSWTTAVGAVQAAINAASTNVSATERHGSRDRAAPVAFSRGAAANREPLVMPRSRLLLAHFCALCPISAMALQGSRTMIAAWTFLGKLARQRGSGPWVMASFKR
jgi:hypothetical protein